MFQDRKPWLKTGWMILVGALLVGGVLRFYDLGGPSFSDDEVYKVNAVDHYRHGQFQLTADDEHPMLMKLGIWGSYLVRELANAHLGTHWNLESATRAPNALAGTLMILVLAFLGRELFSRRVGLIVAWLWAVETNAIGFNRIAKEDTLVALFLALTWYFVLRAKNAAERGERVDRFELGAALSIGLMCASKYFFHLALTPLFFYLWVRKDTFRTGILGGTAASEHLASHSSARPWKVPAKRWMQLLGIAVATCLLVNPTVLLPRNFLYIIGFIEHKTIYSHGLWFNGHLYMNQVFEGAQRTPWYFYFVYLGVKLPLLTLAAVAAGLGFLAAHRKSDGARVLFTWGGVWLLVHAFLAGGKFTRYLTHLLPVVMMIAAVGIDGTARALARGWKSVDAGRAWAVSLATLVLLPALWAAQKAAPHYKIYLNAIGGGPERLRHFFPHCDFYDVGMREAVQYACSRAEPNAQFRSDAHVAVQYYVDQCHRPDILVTTMSEPTAGCRADRACYQFVQVGRTYFETKQLFDDLHAKRAPDAVVRVEGVDVAEVYGPDRPKHFATAIHTNDEARAAGTLEKRSDVPPMTTVSRLSRGTVVEELFPDGTP